MPDNVDHVNRTPVKYYNSCQQESQPESWMAQDEPGKIAISCTTCRLGNALYFYTTHGEREFNLIGYPFRVHKLNVLLGVVDLFEHTTNCLMTMSNCVGY